MADANYQWCPLIDIPPGTRLAIATDTPLGPLQAGTLLERELLDRLAQAGQTHLPRLPEPVAPPDAEALRTHLAELFSMAGEHAGARQLQAALLDYRLNTPAGS